LGISREAGGAGGTGVAHEKEIVVQQEFRGKVEDEEAMMFLTSF
jgi:hypothetical protein